MEKGIQTESTRSPLGVHFLLTSMEDGNPLGVHPESTRVHFLHTIMEGCSAQGVCSESAWSPFLLTSMEDGKSLGVHKRFQTHEERAFDVLFCTERCAK